VKHARRFRAWRLGVFLSNDKDGVPTISKGNLDQATVIHAVTGYHMRRFAILSRPRLAGHAEHGCAVLVLEMLVYGSAQHRKFMV
jgi:hypothetical protein